MIEIFRNILLALVTASITQAEVLTAVLYEHHLAVSASSRSSSERQPLFTSSAPILPDECAALAYGSSHNVAEIISTSPKHFVCRAVVSHSSPPIITDRAQSVVGICPKHDMRCNGTTEYMIAQDYKPSGAIRLSRGFNGTNATTASACERSVIAYNQPQAGKERLYHTLAKAFWWKHNPEAEPECHALEWVDGIESYPSHTLLILAQPLSVFEGNVTCDMYDPFYPSASEACKEFEFETAYAAPEPTLDLKLPSQMQPFPETPLSPYDMDSPKSSPL